VAGAGIPVDESIECIGIGSGEATDRLLGQAANAYKAVNVGANRFQFARTYRPTWAVVLGCVFAPVLIGLLFFLVKSTETWAASFDEDHRRVRVRIQGRVLPQVLVAIREVLTTGAVAAPAQSGVGLIAEPVGVPGPVGPPPLTGSDGAAVPASPPFAPPGPPPVVPGTAQPVGSPLDLPPPVGAPSPLPAASTGAPLPADAPFAPPAGTPLAMGPPPSPVAPSGTPPSAEALPDVIGPVPGPDQAAPAPEPWWVAGAGGSHGTPGVDPSHPASVIWPAGVELRVEGGDAVRGPGPVLVGRDPAAGDGEDGARVLVVDDPSVSKTHLRVDIDDSGVWLTDRDSTNGSTLERPGAPPQPLAAGVRHRAAVGDTVRIGTRRLTIQGGPGLR
jgi:hypothetical protein